MSVNDKMLERVRGLLAKAESVAEEFPDEAEALTAKATELMAQYGIDAAMAAAKKDTREVPVDKAMFFPQPYAKQHTTLFYNILKIFGGEAVVVSRPGRNSRTQVQGITMHIYAFEADLTAVEILYTSLLLQATTRLNATVIPSWENARSFRVSWWIGFTNVIIGRLKAAHKVAEETSKEPGTALVLRDRALEVQSVFKAAHARTRHVASSTANSRSGYYGGEDAGRRANLHDRQNVGQKERVGIH